ncbi:MAG: hypothetical protein EBR82_07975 [Caulobacteraceae bacterium]|nr:hypothetical protein [Caulobacteraceae bacterium]
MDTNSLREAAATLRTHTRDRIGDIMGRVRWLAMEVQKVALEIEGTTQEEEDLREVAAAMLRYSSRYDARAPEPPPVGALVEPHSPKIPEAPAIPEPVSVYDADTATRTLEAPSEPREFLWLRPDLWNTLAEAQAALRGHIQQEHAARTQTRAIALEAVVDLALLDKRTEAQEIELSQHSLLKDRLRNVDAVRADKLAEVAALTSLESARAYAGTVPVGWET